MSYQRHRERLARFVRLLLELPPEEQRERLARLSPEEMLQIDTLFEAWAHEGQLPPKEQGWRTWLMMAGRGFGKTRAGAQWVYDLGWSRKVRIALVAGTIDEARRVMIEGTSGLLQLARRWRQRFKWEPSKGELTWPRGTVATLYSADNPDGLRGPEHHFAWCDELAKWRQADATWDNLQMGLRGGLRARALVTTTPRAIPLLERIRGQKWTVETGGRTADNLNLSRDFIDAMTETYGGTRLGAQELDGVLLGEAEGSLWPRALIERCRGEAPEGFDRVVVGVDPPGTTGERADACGIVVAGSRAGRLYVLADESVAGLSPEGWAQRVAAAGLRWNTTQVIAEANHGGAMVASVLKAADSGLRVRLVHARYGKAIRAEPIALKFEAGKAVLCGNFAELEAELNGLIAGGGYEGPGRSPDRADAMVWALTALGETRSGLPRVTRV